MRLVAAVMFMLLPAIGHADSKVTVRKNSIGESRITVQRDRQPDLTGTSRTNSIGQTRTQWSNGVKCLGSTNSIGVYTERCH